MKILYFGEYSGLHTLLARGMRELGHQVTLVGDGNSFRNYPRDIDIKRKGGLLSGLRHYIRLKRLLPLFSGYDIVQFINPDCFGLQAERQYDFYQYLRRHNQKILVGAFGCDWYWVDDGIHHNTFRYGDFYIGSRMRNDVSTQKFIYEYTLTPKGEYTRYVMQDADMIPACLYEYQACYSRYFPDKVQYIPLPIIASQELPSHTFDKKCIRFFIGIDKERSVYKGTDIMLDALNDIAIQHPEKCEVVKVENLPFTEYEKAMDSCDVMLDQLYSYTPSMNSLLAMSKGIVVVGGGEPENYEILHETELRPIVNVEPTYEGVISSLKWLLDNMSQIDRLKAESIAYVKKHHDYRKIAKQYEQLYHQVLNGE